MNVVPIMSAPGSGRTWLSVMLGAATGVDFREVLRVPPGLPRDYPHPFAFTHLFDDEYAYRGEKLARALRAWRRDPAYLTRNPWDAINAWLWHKRLIEKVTMTAAEEEQVIREAARGYVALHEVWAQRDGLWVSYCDLIADPAAELERVCEHVGVEYQLEVGVEAGRPEVMALVSNKVRRATVGAYCEELTEAQIDAITEAMTPAVMARHGHALELQAAA